jgi:hypothetical protein
VEEVRTIVFKIGTACSTMQLNLVDSALVEGVEVAAVEDVARVEDAAVAADLLLRDQITKAIDGRWHSINRKAI